MQPVIIGNFPVIAAERMARSGIEVDTSYCFQYDRAYAADRQLVINHVDGAAWYVAGDAQTFWLFAAADLLFRDGVAHIPVRHYAYPRKGNNWCGVDTVPNQSFTPIPAGHRTDHESAQWLKEQAQ